MCLLLLGAAAARAEPPAAELLKLHEQEAAAYRIYRGDSRARPLTLSEAPVFSWTNLAGESTQLGHVFVWLDAGRPEAIGTIFSARAVDQPGRMLVHEFHSLSTEKLLPETPPSSMYQWRPERGIELAPCEGDPPVGGSAPQRSIQMRSLARKFAAESRNREGQRWELRLLPAPLLQYEPSAKEVLHGALFAMVSSAGTDPELLLMIEARRLPDAQDRWTWCAAALRFSDRDLIVHYDGALLWSSLEDDSRRAHIKNNYTLIETPDRTYTCYRARTIPELADSDPGNASQAAK
jgi:hypothetical protein